MAIAVVGPLAATLYEDWYSPALPYQVTVADGLAAAGAAVTVHEGADRVRTDLGDFDVFDWGDDIVTLRGVASAGAGSGRYLTVTSDGTLAVTADKPHGWTVRETFRRTLAARRRRAARFDRHRQSFRLSWEPLADGVAEAIAAAGDADVAVVVVGNDPMIGGREAHDRATLALPRQADRLVREVTAACPRTVVVIMSSYPYLVPDAPAIDLDLPRRAGGRPRHRRPDRRQARPGGPAPAGVARRRRGPARPARLRHHQGRLDVPVRDRAAAVPVRPRPDLHDVRVRPAAG